MDEDAVHQASAPNEDINTAEPEAELTNIDSLDSIVTNIDSLESMVTNIDSLESIASSGDLVQIVGNTSEVLTRVELDLACFSEKLVNLNILMMHIATRESDFEAFVSDKEDICGDSIMKAMEFNLLSGVLDSEVSELDNFMSTIQSEIIKARETVYSRKNLGQALAEMEDKLHDSEESLKQSLDQVSELRVQSANFQRILSSFGVEENWKGEKGGGILGSGEFLDHNAKIKMQTAEQQRHFLRMYEKSLARELDLEKKVGESKQSEEEMKFRLYSSEQDVFYMEEAAAVVWERLFEAENAAEVLMGISKETLGQLQIAQFNLNGSFQREKNLRLELQESLEKLKAKDHKLALADSEASTLREKVSSLEKHLKESELKIEKGVEDLKEKNSSAESRAESAEAKCKLLTETNMKLNEDSALLKSTSEKLDSLERQLRESDIQLQHALVSAEASQEKESMLYSTIHDMEHLIEDLKSRVSKADCRADSAEEKCITLCESNSDLNDELRFLRSRLGLLEASLHQAEETKMATAKDIGVRTKVIANLVMQLALERERLHKQISSLERGNKILLQQTDKDPSRSVRHDGRGHGFSSATCEIEPEEASNFTARSVEVGEGPHNMPVGEAKLGPADSASKLETVRNIDARQLNLKYSFMAALTLAIAALTAFVFQRPQ
ncbi:WPP domain-interacting tail-anchored protein 1 [Rhododendron vialii]|uniref:WPP domain-interacting tail-anchored protein 1 n=1 Tax=Rhododendron vialii TaxID=182163 RepID=UPI0026600A1E|nr:WPP domain-interacting tail-anchored protein 1 [Rhododendron vialii]XP_058227889.1 WPP domain-interacting tail-anchored protein 1 [Rhododendron vialii]